MRTPHQQLEVGRGSWKRASGSSPYRPAERLRRERFASSFSGQITAH